MREICNSRAYQRSVQSTESNQSDTRNFAKSTIRRVRAEVLLDIISQVTDTQNKFRGLPNGSSAVEIVDGGTSTFFLTTFGRATRTTVCSAKWLSNQTSHRRSICLMAIPSTISAVRAVSSGNCCKPGKVQRT